MAKFRNLQELIDAIDTETARRSANALISTIDSLAFTAPELWPKKLQTAAEQLTEVAVALAIQPAVEPAPSPERTNPNPAPIA